MVDLLQSLEVSCPYCGETFSSWIDASALVLDESGVADVVQDYYEDCQICCQPIRFLLSMNVEGHLDVQISSDDD